MDTVQIVFVLFMAVSLAACAGLRAFIPPLAVSILALSGHITLAHGFEWLARPEVALIFGLAALLEIAGDKFPAVDHFLDAAGIVIKPAMGALLGMSMISGMDPIVALCIGIVVGGGTAGIVHVLKAKTRLASSMLTAGLANPLISTIEDVVAVVWVALAAVWPYLTILLLLLLGIGLWRFLSRHRKREPSAAA